MAAPLAAVAAFFAACGGKSAGERAYAVPAGTAMALEVVVREELVEAKTAWRVEVASSGAFAEDGSLHLEIVRARMETHVGGGETRVVATDDPPEARGKRTSGDVAKARLLEILRGAKFVVRFDPVEGVTAVEGLDRALEAAPADDETAGLRTVCSDARWRRDLLAAGLCAVPRAVRDGGAVERTARVLVPGKGGTTMRLVGSVGRDEGGSPAAGVLGKLGADAVFDGPTGAAPPAIVGDIVVASVVGEATTSYPAEGGLPFKGQFTLTMPFAGGLTERALTKFTLVRK